MENNLVIYNSLTRVKEPFQPLHKERVGMYVCGPTVYSNVHLGNCRTFLSFDLIYRYLTHIGFKVRYVRNITDVGHLENDADAGEDKIAKKARLEQIEPMEVVQRYTVDFHNILRKFNMLPPNIEPMASGHIIEQIEMTKKIMELGLAYEKNGSVYFDVEQYNQNANYGALSGRKIEDLLSGTRELDNQEEKKNALDFALWKKASPEHIMRWPSPWGMGFPGWHLECSVMSSKYLGETFDIHGGGMDLQFPHHECEIAQCTAANGTAPVKYWIHGNMLTFNGARMSKSAGNSILPGELFSGEHKLLDQKYSPNAVRFFMLQAHYRSTLDISNDALKAAEKGLNRLFQGIDMLNQIQPEKESSMDVNTWKNACYSAMNDDFNSPVLISHLFEGVKFINNIVSQKARISEEDLEVLCNTFNEMVFDVLGLQQEKLQKESDQTEEIIQLLISLRNDARANNDYDFSDKVRDGLADIGITIKDSKEGTTWTYES